ncbi:MAG: DUF4402 domain-containing protein [Erythrobacter sp.]|uniref:DUF4402 domain-containing protein n=1 Tax=Erythrobacter sp. TaxID=1042 RepID=UPI00260F692F|nr:DUF4402 domain-containing protein [Erythrobacter sp.]MDJ0978223.1 DUF4402 domain-containing protein [Erythrobacter sp.]
MTKTLRRLWRAIAAAPRAYVRQWAAAIAIFTATLALLTPAAQAQETETADARAFLVTPLSFVKETDLDFGIIIPGNSDGTVFMDSTGAITTTNGITVQTGTQQPARFWGYGQFNQRVLININQNTYTLTRVGGTETMLYDQVTIGSQPPILITTRPTRFRIANPDGYFAFTIAGRLQVAEDQAPGVYEGEFTVTLEYE